MLRDAAVKRHLGLSQLTANPVFISVQPMRVETDNENRASNVIGPVPAPGFAINIDRRHGHARALIVRIACLRAGLGHE